jgi:hypothetical protein
MDDRLARCLHEVAVAATTASNCVVESFFAVFQTLDWFSVCAHPSPSAMRLAVATSCLLACLWCRPEAKTSSELTSGLLFASRGVVICLDIFVHDCADLR